MYNHYIPQSDGSFRRSPMQEPPRRSARPVPTAPPPSPPPEPKPEVPPCPPPEQDPQTAPPAKPCPPQAQSPLDFLRKLLPKDLDIHDLIIIGILLLLSGEDCEDDLSPMLTIALYFLL